MGASASKKDDATSKQGAPTRGPITFDEDTLNFVKGGPLPPPSETSTRLQPRWNEAFMRLTQKAREKQASRAMSTREALQAFKGKFGESAFVEAFGDEDKYLKSIVRPVTVTGTSSKLWHLGPRAYDIRSKHGQEIQATAAQRTGATILAPSDGVVALEGGDDATRWKDLELVPSSAARDAVLNYWEGFVNSKAKPFQILWAGGDWSGDEEPPKWDDLIKSPSGRKPPENTNEFYRGPLARGVTYQCRMTEGACEGDATMLEHWARAAFYVRRLVAILKKERKAFEAMRDKSEAKGNGGGRPRRGPRRSHDPRNAYAALTRTKTEELIEEDPATHYQRHHAALKGQIANNEPLLEAIAKDVDVPRGVLTALDQNDRAYLLSPAITVNLPGLGPNLVKGNWDHTDEGWKDDPSVAIRELRLRRLTWDKLNKKFPGYEHFIKDENAAERLYLDAYLNSALCFDRSFGEWFQFEFEIDDEAKWWGQKTGRQQDKELHYIRNHLLKGAIWGATEGDLRVEATGRDAELLRILRERWGDGLVFEHTDSSEPGHISGHFRAPAFMDRGVTSFSIDHVALGCVRRDGVLYRIVGVRGLLPQDMNMHASGYEFVKALGLEAWVEDHLKNAYCEVGVGGLDKSEAVFGYRPNVFDQGAMRRGG